MFKAYPLWNLILWFSLIAAFFTLEFLGVFKSLATLTGIIKHVIPPWLRAGIIGWIAYHFLVEK